MSQWLGWQASLCASKQSFHARKQEILLVLNKKPWSSALYFTTHSMIIWSVSNEVFPYIFTRLRIRAACDYALSILLPCWMNKELLCIGNYVIFTKFDQILWTVLFTAWSGWTICESMGTGIPKLVFDQVKFRVVSMVTGLWTLYTEHGWVNYSWYIFLL